MKYGLKDDIITGIQQVLASLPEIEQVILYGSRAKGNYKPGSDIDITILGNNVTLATINQASMLLDELNLPYTFDISVYKHIDNVDLLDHIKRVGIVFYEKGV